MYKDRYMCPFATCSVTVFYFVVAHAQTTTSGVATRVGVRSSAIAKTAADRVSR